MWARSAYFGVLVSSYPDLVYHGLHKKPPLDTPQLAGGRKAEIRQRRILLLVYGK
jgi:hypothetical protein